jgi:hypothetical protein
MSLKISDDQHSVIYGNKVIYYSPGVEVSNKFFGMHKEKIILRLFRPNNNIICIDKAGKIIWEAEDTYEDHSDPYQSFYIKDGKLVAIARLADVTINLDNGKILEKKYAK